MGLRGSVIGCARARLPGEAHRLFVLEHSEGAKIVRLRQTETHDFRTARDAWARYLPAPAESVKVLDANRDGLEDFLFSSPPRFYRGRGGLPFYSEDTGLRWDRVDQVFPMDLDGRPPAELVVQGGGICVLARTGGSWIRTDLADLSSVRSIRPADLDGDGDEDLAISRGGEFVALRNDRTGVLVPWFSYPRLSSLSGFGAVDVDRDGALDLVEAGGDRGTVIAYGVRDGFDLPGSAWASMGKPTKAMAADLNGDGRLDFVLDIDLGPDYVVLSEVGGGYGAPLALPALFGEAAAYGCGDFDGDGKKDLVALVGALVEFLPGRGDGQFSDPVEILVGYSRTLGMPSDVDGDGRDDLLLSDANLPAAIEVYWGGPSFAAAPPARIPSGTSLNCVEAADLNGDGIQDLVGEDKSYSYWYAAWCFPARGDVRSLLRGGSARSSRRARSPACFGIWTATAAGNWWC